MDHGFLACRRKEGALLVLMIAAWRARRQGTSFILNHDLANAFGSIEHGILSTANEDILLEEGRGFGEQQFRWSGIGLPLGYGQEVLVRNQCGPS